MSCSLFPGMCLSPPLLREVHSFPKQPLCLIPQFASLCLLPASRSSTASPAGWGWGWQGRESLALKLQKFKGKPGVLGPRNPTPPGWASPLPFRPFLPPELAEPQREPCSHVCRCLRVLVVPSPQEQV